ncbi:MAG: DNA-binding protein [Paludibacteraceae bacterium]|nr:DNA-binding protein [Paludibacteraceae bacterium]
MATGILKYKLKTRINPQDKDAEPKWYAKAVQDRTIDFEGLVTHMSEHNSPYSRGVIHGVLTDMLDCVKELVLDGKSVRLGDLGLFSVGLKTKGALSREKFSVATNVKGVILNVRNTKSWSNSELRKQTTLQELTGYDDGNLDEDEEGGEEEVTP